ncbi:hypothetical protein KKB16_04460, partial [Patescibacteria group bacterium]|nr:hypothetical protein [Patescibacteria group bacterium]
NNKKFFKRDNVSNVNVVNENNYLSNVNNEVENALNNLMNLLDEQKNKPKVVAEEIMKKLGDDESNLNFHIKMAKNYKAEVLFECLSLALNAKRMRMIRTSLPKYYVGILKRKGFLFKNRNYD